LLARDGVLRGDGVVVADQEFRVGDRVIARRNDRHRDVDNGTLAKITEVDSRTGALKVLTDPGDDRLLDAAYAAQHLEHAYALTGHGALGATVEWAGVIGRPFEFSREWPTPRSLARVGARGCM
jgi:ATP-dependent exoDNAse (exonuclease V) alpha subunit